MTAWERVMPKVATGGALTRFVLAAAILFVALGHLLIFPPFEGFDEMGHYSYAREMADTGKFPLLGTSYLDQWIKDYRKKAPFFYTVDENYFEDGSITYPAFFALSTMSKGYQKEYREKAKQKSFTPSDSSNWITQHPPFYYMILAGMMELTDWMPFVSQLFALRLFSFLLAFAGFLVGLKGSREAVDPSMRRHVDAAFLLYPLVFPVFYPEFARLGNDSLCLFLVGIVWSLILKWSRDEHDTKRNIALGICLALGMMTKAFFLSITGSFGLMALYRLWRDRANKRLRKDRIDDLTLVFTPVLFASYWYLYALFRTGSLTNHVSYITIAQHGGWIKVLLEHGLSSVKLFQHVFSFVFTWIWAEGQSTPQIPVLLLTPLFVLAFYLVVAYVRQIKAGYRLDLALLPIWIIVPMLALLFQHVFIYAVVGDQGSTPAWYLHVIAPVFAFAFAYSLRYFEHRPKEKKIFHCLLVYAIAFIAVHAWLQMTLFSGCSIEKSLKDRYYSFPNNFVCLDRFHEVMNHLGVLGWPWHSLTSYGVAMALFAIGLWRIINSERENPETGLKIAT